MKHHFLLLVASASLAVPCPAAQKTWNGGVSSWSDPAAWDPAGVPGPLDEVHIGGGSVALGAGAAVGQRLVWTGGTLHSGVLEIAATASVEVSGSGEKTLHAMTLVNGGTWTLADDGPLACRFTGYNQSVVITNLSGALFEITGTGAPTRVSPGGWPGPCVLHNLGALRKSGPAAAAMAGVTLDNHGVVEVAGGSLALSGGGTSAGRFITGAGSAIALVTGTYDLEAARWEGPGPVRVVESATINGAFDAENFGLAAGDLGGTFEVRGAFAWTGGRLVSARARLGPGNHRIDGLDAKELHLASLANAGQLEIAACAVGVRFTGYHQSAAITNEPAGVIRLVGDATLEQRNPGGWPPALLHLVNEGTLRSVADGTNLLWDVPLHNRGLVAVEQGLLRHRGGGTCSGTWSVAEGAAAEWWGGSYRATSGAQTGPGPLRLAADLRLDGDLTASNLVLAAGVLSGDCTVSGGFHWTGGRLGGAGLRLGPGNHAVTGRAGQTMHASFLVNEGSLVLEDTQLDFQFSGYNQVVTLTNAGTLELRSGSIIRQFNPGGWTPLGLVLRNTGTLRCASETTNTIESIPLHNAGRVEIESGVLAHTGGGVSPGEFRIAPAGRFQMSGGTFNLGDSDWTGGGPARIVGGSTLAGTFNAANFGLEAGDLTGLFEVGGSFEWTGGRLVNAQTRLGPGAHRVASPADKELINTTLANAGHLVVEDCTVGLRFTAYNQRVVVTNEVGGILELLGAARLEQRNPGGWPPLALGLVNEGELRTTGEGTKGLASIPLHNTGTVNLRAGELAQTGGGSSPGQFVIGDEALLTFGSGTYNLADSRWSGAGHARITSGATLSGTFTGARLTLEAGDVTGVFGFEGAFTWTGGNLVNAAVRLGPGQHRFEGTGTKDLINTTLTVGGHLTVQEATVGFRFTGYNQELQVTNEPSGTIEFAGAARFEQRNAGGWPPRSLILDNRGTLLATGEAPKAVASIPLHNRGLVDVQQGAFTHTGGGSSPGRFVVADGAACELATGTFNLEGSRWTGPGPGVVAGTATINGAFDAERFVLAAGDLSGNLEVRGGFQWTGGRLANATLRLGPGDHQFSGPDDKVILNAVVENAGHLVIAGGPVALAIGGYNQRATLLNQATGTLDLDGEGRIEQRNTGGWPPLALGLTNDGHLRKLGPGTAVLASVPLTSHGHLEVAAGRLQVNSQLALGAAGRLTVPAAPSVPLVVSGAASLAGEVFSRSAPGVEPGDGALTQVLEAGSLSGTFLNSVALNPGHTFVYDVSYTPTAILFTARNTVEQPVSIDTPGIREGHLQFDLTVPEGLFVIIESSTDLVTWQHVATLTGTPVPLVWADPEPATATARFYRASLLP